MGQLHYQLSPQKLLACLNPEKKINNDLLHCQISVASTVKNQIHIFFILFSN